MKVIRKSIPNSGSIKSKPITKLYRILICLLHCNLNYYFAGAISSPHGGTRSANLIELTERDSQRTF